LESRRFAIAATPTKFDGGIIYHRVCGCKEPLFAAARGAGKITCDGNRECSLKI
jgi:hypothetical protein